ncbi:unnamed protein product [Hymenolepis diminuta]|uniref:Uncharacterized protein n=1 Tax=Hymenolepis diminuta TaxID=6216 RepID=A0A564Y0J4_HYMDI|nr:unnamed protein product [Hymenolepis diminuta]
MLSIDKRLVLKIVVLTSIFWICVQFVLLQYLISPREKLSNLIGQSLFGN